ncbi:MAG: DUF3817 domain-containing protein [Planctomycetes bacterium]|nr:DUF3817 domain-containing protein [Planctomycetota bacterium]
MRNPVRFLRVANFVEAVSYIVLVFVAMPLKYVWHEPLAVKVFGWVHGILFAIFCLGLVRVVFDAAWPARRTIGVFGAALLPIVPFFVDRRFPQWVAEWRPPPARENG